MTYEQKQIRRFSAGPLVALACASVLAACSGGERVGSDRGDIIRNSLTNRLSGKTAQAPSRITPEQASQAAALATQPLMLIELPQIGSNALIAKIGENGPVETFATASRQTVSTQNGLVRGTRGLGGDLMSADLGSLPHLVANRRSGTTQRELRFLNGEDITVRYRFTCEVQVEGPSSVIKGTTTLLETCQENGTWFRFKNKYHVDGRGRVAGSEQWLGNGNGTVTLRQLRF
ncbi:YjbF family lipoprotein [Marinovum sp.]|uniref:YjbF family lipoprotein n=1 Tax=Marinovum sp. TaxID=2024839 RepID=UPI003A8FD5D8